MNLKHEMFWNLLKFLPDFFSLKWTLNMKCFEIDFYSWDSKAMMEWTLNMKCFEMNAELIDKETKKLNEP